MKTLKNILFIVLAGILLTGCDDFLDLAPISNSNAVDFYKSKADIEVAVNAAYATLYTCYGPDGGASYCGEQMSDDATMEQVAGNMSDRWAFKDYALYPSNTIVFLLWQQYYNSLFNVNIVLDKIEGAGVEESYKTEVKAQLRFLRALYYFDMVRIWGELPIVAKVMTAEESYDILRSPVSDVYNLIIEDLQYSVLNSPLASQASRKGMVTKGAAQMLLGKVYLTMGDKTNAITQLSAVYESDEYKLVDNYADLWKLGNKNTSESIFEVQYLGGAGNPYSVYYPAFSPFENFTFTSASGGMNLVTNDLYNEYEESDIRRDLSIDTGYFKKINDTTNKYIDVNFTIKWVDTTVTYGKEYCNNNFMVLRYADLLLLLSEATGNPKYLNEVRDRVKLPRYGEAGYPTQYSTLDLAIEHERRVELAMEFHRWFDLKRFGRAEEVLTAKKGKEINSDMLLLPIPETVRKQNNAITQNPGYSQ